MRRDAVGEVAGRRARDDLEPELDGARRRHRDDAVLVRQRRVIDGVVLDVELADAEPLRQPRAADERREAGVKTGLRVAGNRQQLTVSPEVFRPPFDNFTRQANRCELDFELRGSRPDVAGRQHSIFKVH